MRARKRRFNRGFVTVAKVWCDTCDKQAYPNRKAALAAANTQGDWSSEDIRAYHSVSCHAWHIGHPRAHAR